MSDTQNATTEIERRFVPDDAPDDLEQHPSEAIRQGYLAEGDRKVVVRVRQRDDRFVLTVKGGAEPAQTEVEVDLSEEQFEALWPFTEGKRVTKTRYSIALDDGHTAEVDRYEKALDGCLVAEVEFDSEAASEAFEPPSWLGREVTGNYRYRAHALAQYGWPGDGETA